jgi:hypothetical protein
MLWGFIKWLIGSSCSHYWVIHEEKTSAVCEESSYMIFRGLSDVPISYYEKSVILRCSKCGDMKHKKFKM